ncbi:MAG TPA: ABC transporter ATP-binding protein [Polyangiaceae bacterium]|nr:ABC transporter ATP-binding protein [Polyangiaceae bacterium]
MIDLDDVEFGHGDGAVLRGFELHVGTGRSVVLLGPSGSGKTSVLRLILGFATPRRGTIRIAGELVSSARTILVPPEERGLGVVFQDLALWPHLTVRDNLTFGLADLAEREQNERIAPLLERLGLRAMERRYPAELSGGERQRVAIARALALEPRAILLDEPLANLDAPLKRELLQLFRELFRERQATVLYVTHSLDEAALGDDIAVLENGKVAQQGSLDELRAAPSSDFIRQLFS